jgi:excisionase family DNA binding protein
MSDHTTNVVVVTITEAERLLKVSRATLYRWIRDGFITAEQITPGAPWRIRIDQALRDRIKPEAPEGWLSLDEAAKALGSPDKPCCTRSNAANCKPSTSTGDAEKDYVSRSKPTKLDYSTRLIGENAQC